MKNKKKIMFSAVVAVLAAVTWIFACGTNTVKEVEGETLQAHLMSQVISVTGNVEAKDMETIILSTQQKVKKIYVSEGQIINKTDIILTVDATDLNYQLNKYRLNLDLANRNLKRLLEKDIKGDKKSLENAIKHSEINRAEVMGDYNEATRKYEQTKILFENGAVSKEELFNSEKYMNNLNNKVELSEIELNNSRNSLNDFDTNYSAQIADQRNEIESAKLDIENAEDKISACDVKANVGGKIVSLGVKEDQYPSTNNNSITIYDLSEYKIVVEASQYDAVSISLGQKADIKVKGQDKKYIGKVSKIDEAAFVNLDWANKKAKVRIEITVDNPDDMIKVGYEADIDITLKESPNALAVNLKALQQGKNGKQSVFVIEHGRAVKKDVKTGLKTDFDTQIIEGLKSGEVYIKNLPEDLKDGDRVSSGKGIK